MSAIILKNDGTPYPEEISKQFKIGYSHGVTTVEFQGKIFRWNPVKEKFICMEKNDPIDFCKRHKIFSYDKPIECWDAYELDKYVEQRGGIQ